MPKKLQRKNSRSHKHINFYFVLGVIITTIIGLIIFSSFLSNTSQKTASTDDRKSLQLETFYPTTTPIKSPIINTAKPTCPHDTGKKIDPASCGCIAEKLQCQAGKCIQMIPGGGWKLTCKDWPDVCDPRFANAQDGDGWYCIAKPVIYLYPEKDTYVDVRVATSGKVVISDPHYPLNGWKNVLAKPSGELTYQGKQYRELFYESETETVNPPKKGLIIKRNELKIKLKEYITLLGLTRADEQEEFLDWWIPRLQALNSPYIFFSILDKSEKLRLDQVFISPKPDVFIEFIAYFKPMDKAEKIELLEITPAPERTGFTAVEWGGIIDR